MSVPTWQGTACGRHFCRPRPRIVGSEGHGTGQQQRALEGQGAPEGHRPSCRCPRDHPRRARDGREQHQGPQGRHLPCRGHRGLRRLPRGHGPDGRVPLGPLEGGHGLGHVGRLRLRPLLRLRRPGLRHSRLPRPRIARRRAGPHERRGLGRLLRQPHAHDGRRRPLADLSPDAHGPGRGGGQRHPVHALHHVPTGRRALRRDHALRQALVLLPDLRRHHHPQPGGLRGALPRARGPLRRLPLSQARDSRGQPRDSPCGLPALAQGPLPLGRDGQRPGHGVL